LGQEQPVHTFAIVNQKGGCGKTTTAINLAGVFAGRGYRTLLVDMDPQGHCAAGLAIPENRIDLHIGDALMAEPNAPIDPSRLLWRVSRNLDLAPATVRLAAVEAPRGELAGKPDAEKRLKIALSRFANQYDLCLIDCSPAIGLLAYNALVAADQILIPVETGFFSLQGATKQVSAIKSLGKRLGVQPPHRVLATMHDPASMLSKDLLEELQRRFSNRLVPVVIRFDQALKEAASFGQPVVEYAPESNGAKDYGALADWLMTNVLSGDPATEAIEPEAGVEAPAAPAAPLGGGRAADLVSRARKLQAKGQEPAVVVEAKPVGGEATAEPVKQVAAAGEPVVTTMREMAGVEELGAEARAGKPPVPHVPGFGPEVTASGVIFRVPASMGKSVGVAGDFNQWTPERTPMRDAGGGVLECVAYMPPGSTSQYRLVVDGQWIADPFNACTAPNPFGGTNSVVAVPVIRPGMVGVASPEIVVRPLNSAPIGRPA
jgi:chromosome partitioning protein